MTTMTTIRFAVATAFVEAMDKPVIFCSVTGRRLSFSREHGLLAAAFPQCDRALKTFLHKEQVKTNVNTWPPTPCGDSSFLPATIP